MAIPEYVWSTATAETAAGTRLAGATDLFDVLAEPTRAAILGALFEADERLSYSELAAAADIDDNGRLNYHLRQSDALIDQSPAGYTLSKIGQKLVAGVLPVTGAAHR
jgi:citrate synthase